MKKFWGVTFLWIIFSCNDRNNENSKDDESVINGMTKAEWIEHYKDSMMNKITKEVMFDTVGVSQAPIKILKAKLFQEAYSSFKSVSLTFKNVSDKKIDAVRFSWYGENAFKEPADMGGFENGFGGGFMDKSISPGQSMTLQWNILSRDGKTMTAWPIEVVFSDGTKWKSEKNK